MARVGSVYEYQITDGSVYNTVCPLCHSQINVDLNRTVQNATILFIPFIKKAVAYYSVCPCCNKQYHFHKNEYNQILQSQTPQHSWNTVCAQLLEQERNKAEKAINRSSKKTLPASVLALFFGLFGLQNLYMGHIKRFLINSLLLVASVLIFATILLTKSTSLVWISALFLATNVYWGIADFIRILSGHAMDKNKAYIQTNKQHQKRLQHYAQLHTNLYNQENYRR